MGTTTHTLSKGEGIVCVSVGGSARRTIFGVFLGCPKGRGSRALTAATRRYAELIAEIVLGGLAP